MAEREEKPRRSDTAASDHRGAFGEFGGERGAFIERTFREKIILVGVVSPGRSEEEVEASLDELALLVDTAGADEVDRVLQRRATPDPATYIGKGKVEEIRVLAEAADADTVVFDDELTPAQQGNLERLLGRSAIDRTAVILDIFAQNAHTVEGKAQVQLALLRYRLPRLRGKGKSLSQQSGGIGARRGPGETQLEVDRRRVARLIHKLEADLREIGHHRDVQRKSRRRSPYQQVAIVGYTNAGKSTLLNRLTDAGVLVEDRLFATLDATTRRLQLPGGETVLVTDTVGFVTKLPHQLVEAFKSTLEVVAEADLLVHLVDASGPEVAAHMDAVRSVLGEIGAGDVPELLAFNKADLTDEAGQLAASHPGSVALSAASGEGVDELLVAIGDRLRALTQVVELVVPFDRGDVLAAVHREGEVLVETTGEDGMRLRARLDDASSARLAEFVVG
ncbi:GTPase HflX [Actinomarinicola tropica]|uniref:GTPase HflX n=1 Tax=Actinomarinicola tropica TaxID=2789776 RepID=A0A5Q2RH14_9ACTN|nr:GTPase HflX [Actinomarinicola tropica]QGG94924.1 GTPase HflX [Actinomarinicola tropica]